MWATGQLITIDSSVHEGAREYGYHELDRVGRARIVSDNATDIPKSDIKGDFILHPVRTVATSFEYSNQDVRTAQMQGSFDIANEKAQAAREAMDDELDRLILFGSPTDGLEGVVNHPGIRVRVADTPNWQTATGEQIRDSFSNAVNTLRIDTNNIEIPNSCVMDVATEAKLSTKINQPNGGDATVMDFLKKAHPEITNWRVDPNLKDIGPGGSPSILIYRNDPRKLRCVMPMRMRPTPPEQRGTIFEVILESRFGGVMMPRPKAFLRLDGVGAT